MKIWVGIQFEGPVEAEELFSCIEETLVEYKNRGIPFATTTEDEPIEITAWNPEYTAG
jgi:hypothetical protein